MRVYGYQASPPSVRFWRIAVLAAAGAVGTISQAKAQLYYWSDSEPAFSRSERMVWHRPQKSRRHAKKIEAPTKESGKPQGPLIIAISIERQNLKIYDANGFYAQTPISTGMRGHPTPMGVFSVIQKHKFHHSNIYSGAPMPYMQRITWSGVAMHAGVLPGYPASHGCIRMPMAFAVKMWGWTRMGARVVITPGEMTPASFSHPLLVAQKTVAPPVTAEEPKADAPVAPKSDKASDASLVSQPAQSQADLELRPSLGHDDGAKPVMTEPPASIALHGQTRTADASAALPPTNARVTMTDASGGNLPPNGKTAAEPASAPRVADDPAAVTDRDATNTEAKPEEAAKAETAKPEAEPATANSGEAGKTEAAASDGIKAEEHSGKAKVEARADDVKTEAKKADAPKPDERSSEKPGESIKAGTGVPGGPDVNRDQTRLGSETAAAPKPAPAMAAAPKRSGQIAVFVSRKDSKLYVRQNFAPLFDMPVTIAPSDRPLGTHVFTAQTDKGDANILHWSVVSLPVRARYAEHRDADERTSRRRRTAGAVEVKPLPMPNAPAEALDRINIPADAMARITEALSTGASIIVSDQGITAGETGEGTDFIVSLR
jgi:hypothetical protein